ncbi:hypothetical protein [Serratia sp. (in: enterobacteria)]|uniref:hypothetical protein n=1 Tax=Serratia sp. (in: enterobacteria) TaxID=616 RepID=UPI003989D725
MQKEQRELTKENIKICVGCSDTEVYKLELTLKQKYNNPQDQYFSISGDTFTRSVFSEETGEERAKEYLTDDKELWKQAVEHDNTEKGLEDWAEEVLNYDGWEHVLGDIIEVDIDGTTYYTDNSGGGQIDDCLDNLIDTDLEDNEINIIREAWDQLHLKKFSEIYANKEQTKLLNEVIAIFEKYENNEMLRFFEVD